MLVERREVGPDRHTDGSGKGRDGGGVETGRERESRREGEREERESETERQKQGERERTRESNTGAYRDSKRKRKREEQGRPWVTDVRSGGVKNTVGGDELTEMGQGAETGGRTPKLEWSGYRERRLEGDSDTVLQSDRPEFESSPTTS